MVKLAKGAKLQGKPKKAPPPAEVDDSEEDEEMEEEESSEEEVEVPVKKTPAKKAATPAKATPGKKAATPAKPAATPGKKGATPAVAKNGKRAKKQESEEEESDEEESEEEMEIVTKNASKKKPVAKKEESEEEEDDDDEEEDDDDEESEEEKPVAKKPVAKKPANKKPAKKEESEDEDSENDAAIIPPVKGKKAVPAKQEESEDDEDDDEDDDDEEEDDDEEDDDDDEDEKVAGKRKKDMPKTKGAPEAKKQKTESRNEGLSVFVANLNTAKDFDELKDALREFFSKKNLAVQDVRLGASKRFAYVEFTTLEDVEKALTMNGKKILGFEVKVEKANTPADKAKIADNKKERDARTLFVKNIPYSTTSEELQEVFDNAKEIRIPSGKDGSSKGIAYVEFHTEADADKALEEKQGAEVEGRSIFLDYTGEKSQNADRRGPPAGDSKVVLVNNLAYSATEDSLQEVFEKATSIRMPQNPQGRPKGFAFVEFASVEDAKEAIEACNNTEIEGRTIRLEFSQTGGPQGRGSVQSKTLFVKGLSEDTTEETLKEAFDGATNARIVTDRDTGASKGFGFVDFSTAEDAKAAKEAMEDGEIDGNRVTLDFAKPKGDGQRGGRGGFGGRGGGRGGFGGRGGGGRGGFGGRGGGGRGGFGGRGGRGFGGRGGGFRGGNQGRGKKTKFDD